MDAVSQYLDMSTLRTQFIKSKEDSEFNQLLKLQNQIKQKKSKEIAKHLQLDIMNTIHDKYQMMEVRSLKNQGEMILKNFIKKEMDAKVS